MLIRLSYVKDYRDVDAGKTYVFRISDKKDIEVDTEKDNSIKAVWFYRDKEICNWFFPKGLTYIENIMTGPWMDTEEVYKYEDQFIEQEVC